MDPLQVEYPMVDFHLVHSTVISIDPPLSKLDSTAVASRSSFSIPMMIYECHHDEDVRRSGSEFGIASSSARR